MLGAANARDQVKMTKYEEECNKIGVKFVPFVVETYGGFSRKAIDFINQVACWAKENSIFDNTNLLVDEFYKAASCSIQRGNASMTHFGIVKSAIVDDF